MKCCGIEDVGMLCLSNGLIYSYMPKCRSSLFHLPQSKPYQNDFINHIAPSVNTMTPKLNLSSMLAEISYIKFFFNKYCLQKIEPYAVDELNRELSSHLLGVLAYIEEENLT